MKSTESVTGEASPRVAWSPSTRPRDLQHAGQFHTEEVSIEHQFEMPDVPRPETIARLDERIKDEFGTIDEWAKREHPSTNASSAKSLESNSQQRAAPADLDQGRRRVARRSTAATRA